MRMHAFGDCWLGSETPSAVRFGDSNPVSCACVIDSGDRECSCLATQELMG